MPNAVGPLIVLVTLDLGNAIIVFAGLSFLGLGVVPPTPEWGSMVAEGRELVRAMVGGDLPGPGHPDRRARLQLPGRRHPRLARSACQATLNARLSRCRRAAGARPAHLVPHRCRARSARSMASASTVARRRDARHRRRIRLRQERRRQVDHAPARRAGAHRRRRRSASRAATCAHARRGRAARRARRARSPWCSRTR